MCTLLTNREYQNKVQFVLLKSPQRARVNVSHSPAIFIHAVLQEAGSTGTGKPSLPRLAAQH